MRAGFRFRKWVNRLLLLSLGAAASASIGNGLQDNVERVGMDLRSIDLAEPDPALCQSACLADSQCQSFTFAKPGTHGPNAICYLKSGEASGTPNDCCISGLRPNVTPETAESVLYQSHQAFQHRDAPRSSVSGQHDTLAQYSAKCDAATGITIPSFNCSAGVEPGGQGSGSPCNTPNVLNGVCDPGSRFQVLPGSNANAVAVAHCRKQGNAANFYGDIAIIQTNKVNGATCFYQALGTLPGENIPAPISGENAPWKDGSGHWISPQGTEAIGCTACHDNGGLIRSPYLAQLKTAPHALPSTAAGFNNLNTPLKYPGLDFKSNRSWSISTSLASGDSGTSCTACHRLGVSNHEKVVSGQNSGTALDFAVKATAASQSSKNMHSNSSPIWMRPGQITYVAAAENSAKKIRDCARAFRDSGFTSAPAGCTVTPLAEPWQSPNDPDNDGFDNNIDNCKFVANPGQEDVDGDGDGDACDNCKSTKNADQLNTDGDSQGDACDADDDNDNCLDEIDDKPKEGSSKIGSRIAANCSPSTRPVYGWDGLDTDKDGALNCSDNDDDNDGIPDASDPCPIHHKDKGNIICSLYPPVICPFATFWDVCQLGGCNELLLKLVAVVNPDPTIEIFEFFTIRGRTLYINASAKQPVEQIENVIAQKASSATRAARSGKAKASTRAMRLEIWTKNRLGNPGKFVALVAQFNQVNTRQLKATGNGSLKLTVALKGTGVTIQRTFTPIGKISPPPIRKATQSRQR